MAVSSSSLLSVLCAAQFVIILVLITWQSSLTTEYSQDIADVKADMELQISESKANCKEELSEAKALADKALELQEAPIAAHVVPALMQVAPVTTYAGVAATMMLHSPKWFQKRYTVMVLNVINNLPPNWVVQIFYTGKGQSLAGLEVNPGLQRLVDYQKIIMTTIPDELLQRKKKQFQLMTDRWVWSNMLAEKVLIFGGNSALCGNSKLTLNDFLEWDWIGAPWTAMKKRGEGPFGLGGSGGISLRSKSAMLDAIEYEMAGVPLAKKAEKELNLGQEDVFFVSRLKAMNEKQFFINGRSTEYKIAPPEVTKIFASSGGWVNDTVLAASMTLPEAESTARETFLSYCLELKTIFPSLHDPGCFGAKPDPNKCAVSICALRGTVLNPNQERRRGGC